MPVGKHLCLGVVGLGALLVALYAGLTACRGWTDHGGAAVRPSLDEEQRRSALLEADRELLRQSIQVNQRIREDLVAGRLSLREAAAALAAENARRPGRLRASTVNFPGATQEEWFARLAVEHLALALANKPGGAAVLARLRAELEDYLAGKGGGPGPADSRANRGVSCQQTTAF
jgi:hypothetical protein